MEGAGIMNKGRRHLLWCHFVFSHLRCVALLSIFAAGCAILEHVVLVAAGEQGSETESTVDSVGGRSSWEDEPGDQGHEEQHRLLATRLTTRVPSAKEAQVSENSRRAAAKQKEQAVNFWRGADEEEAGAGSVLAQIKEDQERITSAARGELQTETDKRTMARPGVDAIGGVELRVLPQNPQVEEEKTTGSVYSEILATKTPEEPGSPGPAFQFLEARLVGERPVSVEGGQEEQHLLVEQDIDYAPPSNDHKVGSSYTQKVENANSALTAAEDGTETGRGLAWQQKVQQLEDLVSQQGEVLREQGETIRHLRKELATQQVFQNKTAARIVSAGAVNEIIEQTHVAYTLANMRMDFIVMLVLLLIGYVSVLIGLALPTRLVFFPPGLYLPVPTPQSPVEDVDRSDEQQTTDAAVGALREQRQRHFQKFMLLPHAFAIHGTLSSVCQFQDSSAGKIWTSCLIVYAVCALLSRYTTAAGLYPSWCVDPLGAGEDSAFAFTPLYNLAGMSAAEMLARVLWLVLPCVGFMLTAAVPSPSDDALRAAQQENTEQVGQLIPSATEEEEGKMRETETHRVQESDDAIEYYRVQNTRWQVIIHTVCAPLAMAVLVAFETYAFAFGERISLTVAIFGTIDERLVVDDEALLMWAHYQTFGDNTCTPEEQYVRVQWAPTLFRFRALFLLFSWIFCGAFAIVAGWLIVFPPENHPLSQQNRSRRASAASSTPVFLPCDGSASLLIPKIAYSLEVAALLCVLFLPFFSVMYSLSFRFALPRGQVAEDFQQVLIGSGANLRLAYDVFWTTEKEGAMNWRGPSVANGQQWLQCRTSWGTHAWRDPSVCQWVSGWNQTENGTSLYFWEK
ncbi:unnamed protein product [Amoebophrya sp. A120]|nr:unnamed protein product [Amoebophrya sp. A120]|eukprot:GSA120T00004773001.1